MLAQETVERKMNDDSLNDVSIVNILNNILMYRVKVFTPKMSILVLITIYILSSGHSRFKC